jgi:hypothetical protein
MPGSRIITINTQVIDQFPVFINNGPAKQSGLTTSDFTVTIFVNGQLTSIPVNVAEISSTGEYEVTFTTTIVGYYDIQVLNDFNNMIYFGTYDVVTSSGGGGGLSPDDPVIKRMLGLLHENVYIDNTVFDSCGQLIASRVRLFDTQAHALAAVAGGNDETGLLAVYLMTATYSGPNRLKEFRQVLAYLVQQTTTNFDVNVT